MEEGIRLKNLCWSRVAVKALILRADGGHVVLA
jgi:hypothetical protein